MEPIVFTFISKCLLHNESHDSPGQIANIWRNQVQNELEPVLVTLLSHHVIDEWRKEDLHQDNVSIQFSKYWLS